MLKKVALGVLFIGMTTFLVVGAINRTTRETAQIDEAYPRGGRDRETSNEPNNFNRKDYSGVDAVVVDDSMGRGRGGEGFGRADGVRSTTARQSDLGQAVVDEWLTVDGTVTLLEEDAVGVELESGEHFIIEGRPWSFAQESGFSALVDHQLTLVSMKTASSK